MREEANMATVIAFPKQESKAHDKVEGQSSATIIMFTGVRIERLEDVKRPKRSTSRRLISNTSEATAEELED
jgi:hypothetical protein